MSPGEFGGCLEAHVANKISSGRRPRMHDNVCKAVVEHAVWRNPDAGLLAEWQTRPEWLLLTGTRTSCDGFEGSLSHPILRHAVHELHLVFSR